MTTACAVLLADWPSPSGLYDPIGDVSCGVSRISSWAGKWRELGGQVEGGTGYGGFDADPEFFDADPGRALAESFDVLSIISRGIERLSLLRIACWRSAMLTTFT